ncbi:glycerol-3-phosphate dehydrogenase/oxidase [Mycetocola miduiensis]|uniref:Glycerol-3-phosphate dehydrogenase n=1 Tax=Mycetocola miduiensis TaxID=995034 RepID=A0A1I5C145_9MICO|nr:glycerol-3-phosphate dehydrogenase/oxidase [Mycetocola miduiensis]SFN80770.1 glycerol-3-phosphate dehydrogenase [Mycetocola miduiensis]
MPSLSTYRSRVEPVDVAVIGAGINGLAVAREAAARGMSVALIDQDDVGARTSAISTRLVHGGLKYLERFELNLVFESIRERNILLKQAPHLVRPYPMLIPFSAGQSRPGWLLACGLMLHDVLSAGKKLPLNRVVFRKRIERSWPGLAEGGLKWGGLFQDAQVSLTERLTVELATDAYRNGAVVLTHARVESLIQTDGRVTGLRYRDRDDRSLKEIEARIVVNAAGPWVDDILGMAGAQDRKIGPTKGSHAIVDRFPGAPDTCIFFESPADSRPMFVLPWAGRYMIGTTDLPYDGRLDVIVMDADETKYLLDAVNDLIPQAGLTPDDVLWSYSGVRPLPYVANLDDPAQVTRDHQILSHEGELTGLVTIIGGKLTTHRALGEQVAKLLARTLGLASAASPTRTAPLPGSPGSEPWPEFHARFIRSSRLPHAVATRLVDTYGTAASAIDAIATSQPELAEVLDEDSGAIGAEIIYAAREEGAHTLEDIVLRRTLIGINRDVGLSAAPVAAEILVSHGDWSREYADAQVHAYKQAVRRFNPRVLADDTAQQ